MAAELRAARRLASPARARWWAGDARQAQDATIARGRRIHGARRAAASSAALGAKACRRVGYAGAAAADHSEGGAGLPLDMQEVLGELLCRLRHSATPKVTRHRADRVPVARSEAQKRSSPLQLFTELKPDTAEAPDRDTRVAHRAQPPEAAGGPSRPHWVAVAHPPAARSCARAPRPLRPKPCVRCRRRAPRHRPASLRQRPPQPLGRPPRAP